MSRSTPLFALWLLASLSSGTHAADVKGNKDHPLFSRINGAVIEGYKPSDDDAAGRAKHRHVEWVIQ